jgi:hypothetical protein
MLAKPFANLFTYRLRLGFLEQTVDFLSTANKLTFEGYSFACSLNLLDI